ncbi:helix-turn-helix domain-containing protein [Rhodococcus ruber]|uniref:helix-turn-helix domain-containing protein n=1 Tax=Rhodococcus TaxID=1827 RepID=UPI001376417A|nr:helix-turn-helix transcriptional regulator [Rhodococcus ruber]
MPNIDEDAKRWQVELAGRIGAAVAQWRKKRGLTAVELSEKTASLGYPVSRIAISKIEQGKRAGKMDLSELLVLARALAVPPVLLIYPDLKDGPVEVIPGQTISSFYALRWFTGEGVPNPYEDPPIPAPGISNPTAAMIENREFNRTADRIELARVHWQQLWHLEVVQHQAAKAEPGSQEARKLAEVTEGYRESIARLEREMRDAGMVVDDE